MSTLLLTDPTNPRCLVHVRSRARTRLRTRLRPRQLDRALASHVSPDSSAALSLRAHTLISMSARAGLAGSISQLVKEAEHSTGPLTFRVPICRAKILRSRETLAALADRLVSRDPVDACGVAQVRLLLTDGSGPIYCRPTADDLEPALKRTLLALTL
ncbi:MAG: hypothetical protein ACJ780_03860 [Solirubrobacteraceae bacterium]